MKQEEKQIKILCSSSFTLSHLIPPLVIKINNHYSFYILFIFMKKKEKKKRRKKMYIKIMNLTYSNNFYVTLTTNAYALLIFSTTFMNVV